MSDGTGQRTSAVHGGEYVSTRERPTTAAHLDAKYHSKRIPKNISDQIW